VATTTAVRGAAVSDRPIARAAEREPLPFRPSAAGCCYSVHVHAGQVGVKSAGAPRGFAAGRLWRRVLQQHCMLTGARHMSTVSATLTLTEEVIQVSVEPLNSLDRTTLRERALEALRSAITSGRYRPGDHLGEVDLATHLGISRGTVREALRHLQQEGLVTAGNRGMLRVNTISPKEVRELFRVRAALESLAVAEIIRSNEVPRAVSALRDALLRLEGLDGDFEAKLQADMNFHLLLCTLSGNSMLVEAWRYLEGRIRVTIMNYESDQKPTLMSQDRHRPIVDAIERGDLDTAVQVVEEHMAFAAEQYAPPERQE
jgi:DNA-binding GntR family transcriptional regulator